MNEMVWDDNDLLVPVTSVDAASQRCAEANVRAALDYSPANVKALQAAVAEFVAAQPQPVGGE